MFDQVKAYFNKADRSENLKRLFLIYLLAMCITHAEIQFHLKIFIGLSCLVGIAFRRMIDQPAFWAILCSVLIFNLYFSYTYSSNHYFLAIYTIMAILIDSVRSGTGTESKINSYRSLLILTFGLATIQKIISPYFITGRLIATYILGGGSFYKPLGYFFPDHQRTVYSFYDATTLIKAQPVMNGLEGFQISLPGENFILICVILSMLIICVELIIFLLSATPKYYYHPNFVIALLGFVWITFVFRQEYSFFALLLILFLMSGVKPSRIPDRILKSSIILLLVLDLCNNYL